MWGLFPLIAGLVQLRSGINALPTLLLTVHTASLPTLRKAYRRPDSEPGRVYLVSAASTLVALLVVTDWSFINTGFPLYVLGLDLTIALLAISRIGERVAADAVIAAAHAG